MEIKVRINGTDHKVEAQLIKNMLWVHHQGQTFTVDTTVGTRSKKKAASASSDQIMAPMPGKVTKLLLKSGDKVEKGQAVLVMEAMKMEYTLKSEIPGVIEGIHCAVGDQVTLGKVLVKIQPQAKG